MAKPRVQFEGEVRQGKDGDFFCIHKGRNGLIGAHPFDGPWFGALGACAQGALGTKEANNGAVYVSSRARLLAVLEANEGVVESRDLTAGPRKQFLEGDDIVASELRDKSFALAAIVYDGHSGQDSYVDLALKGDMNAYIFLASQGGVLAYNSGFYRPVTSLVERIVEDSNNDTNEMVRRVIDAFSSFDSNFIDVVSSYLTTCVQRINDLGVRADELVRMFHPQGEELSAAANDVFRQKLPLAQYEGEQAILLMCNSGLHRFFSNQDLMKRCTTGRDPSTELRCDSKIRQIGVVSDCTLNGGANVNFGDDVPSVSLLHTQIPKFRSINFAWCQLPSFQSDDCTYFPEDV